MSSKRLSGHPFPANSAGFPLNVECTQGWLFYHSFSQRLRVLESSSFVSERSSAESISTWMFKLFKLQEPDLFPPE